MKLKTPCLRCGGALETERLRLGILHCLACECLRPTRALSRVIDRADGTVILVPGKQPKRTLEPA